MIVFFLLFLCGLVFIPLSAFAWGPLTHMYLANEVMAFSPLIPAGVYAVMRKFKQDFLYGNVMADIVIGKKYMAKEKNTHSWEVGLSLLENAHYQHQKAFSYGYLSHLAADTVAHDILTKHKRNFGHTFYELKADSIVDKSYWFQAAQIDKSIQKRNDLFMERSLERFLFSFKTNKRIFKGMFMLSFLHHERLSDFIDNKLTLIPAPDRKMIEELREESIDRILDVLQKGKNSLVLKEDPRCVMRPRRFLKTRRTVSAP
ncbi:MAG: zinc dependent phospholipase C family protein [bacterium]